MYEFNTLNGNDLLGEITVFGKGNVVPAQIYVRMGDVIMPVKEHAERGEYLKIESATPFYGCDKKGLISLGTILCEDAEGKSPVTYDFYWDVPLVPGIEERNQVNRILGPYRGVKVIEAFGELGIPYEAGSQIENAWCAGNRDFPNVPEPRFHLGRDYLKWSEARSSVYGRFDTALGESKTHEKNGWNMLLKICEKVPENINTVVGYLLDNSIRFDYGELECETKRQTLKLEGRVREVVENYIEEGYKDKASSLRDKREKLDKEHYRRRAAVGLRNE